MSFEEEKQKPFAEPSAQLSPQPSPQLSPQPSPQRLGEISKESGSLQGKRPGDRPRLFQLSMLLIPLLWVSGIWLLAADHQGPHLRPLDMPSGGGGAGDTQEDAPETIVFYGMDYEGDAFFWCLDKSGSMDWDGAIDDLKQEVNSAILSLSPAAEFSLVAFSSNTLVWSPSPQAARLAEKTAALSWVNSLYAEGWTCLAPAAIQILSICNQSSHSSRQVIILSDGAPFCNNVDTSSQALSEISQANWQQVPIHTIFIGSDSAGIAFMQTLATMNQGSFHICDN